MASKGSLNEPLMEHTNAASGPTRGAWGSGVSASELEERDPFLCIALEKEIPQKTVEENHEAMDAFKAPGPVVYLGASASVEAPPWDPFRDGQHKVSLGSGIRTGSPAVFALPSSDKYLERLSKKLEQRLGSKRNSASVTTIKGHKDVDELRAMNECMAKDLMRHRIASRTKVEGVASAPMKQPLLGGNHSQGDTNEDIAAYGVEKEPGCPCCCIM